MLLLLVLGLPEVALAGPDQDAQDAYATAMNQFHELEFESAIVTIDAALAQVRESGADTGPMLGSLLALRGGLIYATTADRSQTLTALREAIRADYDVELPIELRSEELQALLAEARSLEPRPRPRPVEPSLPPPAPRQDLATAAPPAPPPAGKAVEVDDRPLQRVAATRWPRLYLNLGVGTGIGVAHGTVELSYAQYRPGEDYGPAEQACAIARWHAGNEPLAASPDRLAQIVDPAFVPGEDASLLLAAYDPERCAQRHPVKPGVASAPLHLAPEVMIRVHERDIGRRRSLALLVGAFGRLQLVTGSRVYTEDPTEELNISFYQQAQSSKPRGTRRTHGFTWAAGAKLEALITKRGGKFHGMFGLFGGYGHSRLRIGLPFSNDRNGNSVPDEYEVAKISSSAENDRGTAGECIPVWPYNGGCAPGRDGKFYSDIAGSVRATVPKNDRRIDTLRLGPVFAGILVGFRYQPLEHFGLYGEIDVGGWFPDAGSLLVDINVGPSITF